MRSSLLELRTALACMVAVHWAAAVGCGSTTRSRADDVSGGTSDSGGAVATFTAGTGGGGTIETSQAATTGATGGTAALPDEWLSCRESADCVATFPGCCDHCNEASLENSVAIAKGSVAAYRNSTCTEERSCPRCVSIPDPYLHALCIEGSCTLVDVNATSLVHCSESSECKLRLTACCECDPSASVISINAMSEAAYADLVCGPDSTCGACAADFTDIDAVCDGGRCSMRAFGF